MWKGAVAFLSGARQLITSLAPVMLIEINPVAMRAAGTSTAKLVGALNALGYRRFVTPKELNSARPLADPIGAGDIIVLPESYRMENVA